MAAKKSEKRKKSADLMLRMEPEKKAFLRAAAEKAGDQARAANPETSLGLGPWLIGVGLQSAEKLLGMTFVDFAKGAKKGGR